MKELKLSSYGRRSLVPSPVSRMLNQFAHDFRDGRDINLGVGYVNEDTIPKEIIKEALEKVLEEGSPYRQPLNYGSPQGSPNLIRSIRNYYINRSIGGVTSALMNEKEILIGANGATSLLEAFSEVMEKGIVITGEPMYYIYTEFLERKGFTLLAVPEDKQGIIPEKLKALLESNELDKDQVSYAYIITINNPSGSILSNRRREEIVQIFSDFSHRRDRLLPVIFDKAYEDLIHDKEQEKPVSAMVYDRDNMVYEVGTLSKVIAPGLRMGYMIAPPGELTGSLIQKSSDVGFSAPLINQEISSWLLDHMFEEQLARVNRGYREKARILRPAIDKYLGEWLEECIGGSAGFYFYLTFKHIYTGESSPLFKYLNRITGIDDIDYLNQEKQERVIYIPGEFCVNLQGDMGDKGSRSLRLSYGFESIGNFLRSLELISQACRWAEGN